MSQLILKKLVKIANRLDSLGMYKEATELDEETFKYELGGSQGPVFLHSKLEQIALNFHLESWYTLFGSEGETGPISKDSFGKYSNHKVNSYGDERDPVDMHRFEFGLGTIEGGNVEEEEEDMAHHIAYEDGERFIRQAEAITPHNMSFNAEIKFSKKHWLQGIVLIVVLEYVEAY